MALHWDVSSIPLDVRTVEVEFGEREMSPVTESLIWATIAVGLTRITADNAAEFYARLHLYELVRGPFLHRQGQPAPFTIEQVRAHIGLNTNAGDKTLTKWRNDLIGYALKEYTGDFNRAVAAESTDVADAPADVTA